MKQNIISQAQPPSQKNGFTRRDFLSTSLKAGAAAFTTSLLPTLNASSEGRYNVLFIMVDDLRPLLGCYGHSEMHTPNIDRLAQRGTLFNRAYCQYPVCNPSRTSILTGLRPDTTNVFSNKAQFRETLPNAITLPQHFKAYGYHTQSVGKIAHNTAMQDDTYSWSVPSWGLPITNQGPSNPSWKAFEVEDDALSSGITAKNTVAILKEIQNIQFLLAVGFHTPHLPLYAPKRYYDLYNSENFSLPSSSSPPNNAPDIAISDSIDNLRLFRDIPDVGPLTDAKKLELIWAYAASISYMDAQVGRVLEQLDALRLTEKTVIVFASDHGYHLGEHGTWGKNTLFEVSARSPLIMSVPGQQPNETNALTELVDIYPTLCDACNIPIPLQLEGTSIMPVIENPTLTWKTAAFSQIRRSNGYSMRTGQYRYTEWGNKGQRGRELYDYHADPNETANIANLPENKELVEQLSEQLAAGWQATLPNVSENISVPQTLPWDINNDGIVDIQDLILVSNNFRMKTPEHPKADVNKDGIVDIIDLLFVASHFGESCIVTAPTTQTDISTKYLSLIDEWLTQAYQVNDNSDVSRLGIANLQAMLTSIVPEKTSLLPNYPNPFNPETWIPYDLGTDANVIINIYNLKGEMIKEINVGYQNAGTYRLKGQAEHWDGRNSAGEPVASGVYFYSLQAGNFKASQKMEIIK